MNNEECMYSIALTQVPGIGVVWARNLLSAAGSAKDVFQRRKELPGLMPGITQRVIDSLDYPEAIARAEREFEFLQKNDIRCLTISDEAYPSRLRECDDAPVVLFFKGNTDLNTTRIISMVGTRNATDYGKHLCNQFLKDLKELCPNVLIISGLAYGIDIHAHRAALDSDFPTIGVLAHGLDRIYPHVHRKTAVEMLSRGGLLTEFLTETNPDRYNFVSRNRIVAGMSDATIVVESASKGGSLITADIANGYHRDCFAFPGRSLDTFSQGCNQLIRDNKAALIQSAGDFVQIMGWEGGKSSSAKTKVVQRILFPDLSDEEQCITSMLEKKGELHINNLVVETNIPIHKMNALLFELEMKGVIKVLAGGMYKLLQ